MKQRANLPPNKRVFLLPDCLQTGTLTYPAFGREVHHQFPGSPSSADCRSLGPVSLYNPVGSTFLENPNRWPDWFSKSDGWINESFLHFIYLSIYPCVHSFLHPFLPTSHLAVYDSIFREITRSSALGRSKLRCPAGKVWMVSPQFSIN